MSAAAERWAALRGTERFLKGQRLHRNWGRQISETAKEQAPLAVILGCIDSRNSSELVFDMGIGDIFSVRIAGNVAKNKVLGSIEYACGVAGAKLVVVMGHTSCGAVNAAVKCYGDTASVERETGSTHLGELLETIQESIDPEDPIPTDDESFQRYADGVAVRHVQRTIQKLMSSSALLCKLVKLGRVGVVGALYDVKTGRVHFCCAEGLLATALKQESRTVLPRSDESVPASMVIAQVEGTSEDVQAVPPRSDS